MRVHMNVDVYMWRTLCFSTVLSCASFCVSALQATFCPAASLEGNAACANGGAVTLSARGPLEKLSRADGWCMHPECLVLTHTDGRVSKSHMINRPHVVLFLLQNGAAHHSLRWGLPEPRMRKAYSSSCPLRPRTTPSPEEKIILGVIYGVLLWAGMNAAAPLGA